MQSTQSKTAAQTARTAIAGAVRKEFRKIATMRRVAEDKRRKELLGLAQSLDEFARAEAKNAGWTQDDQTDQDAPITVDFVEVNEVKK
jgi:hypothetical protein